MAMQEVLVARRNEALDRIGKVIATIADTHGVKYGELLNIRHNDPDIASTIRLETLAKILSDVAAEQDKANAQTTKPQEQTSADVLRNAILGATDDDLMALPGYGAKSFGALRGWASTPPVVETDEEALPIAVETVDEQPMQTTETVQTVPASEAPSSTGTDNA